MWTVSYGWLLSQLFLLVYSICAWRVEQSLSLRALLTRWFIGQGQGGSQSSECIFCEEETCEMWSGVKGERSPLLLFFTSSFAGPAEAGKSVFKERMARDRRTVRPQVNSFSKTHRCCFGLFIVYWFCLLFFLCVGLGGLSCGEGSLLKFVHSQSHQEKMKHGTLISYYDNNFSWI